MACTDTLRIIDLVRAGARAVALPTRTTVQTLLTALFASTHPRHVAEKTAVMDMLATHSPQMARTMQSSAGHTLVQSQLKEKNADVKQVSGTSTTPASIERCSCTVDTTNSARNISLIRCVLCC